MSRSARVVSVACVTAVAAVLVAFYAVDFLASSPPTVSAAPAPAGVQLTLQTVASYGHSPHPDWVSYLVRDGSGKWRRTTLFKVPAHSLVHVTVYQYDTATGLRNPFWSQVRGTVGNTMSVDGKTAGFLPPDDASHTFAIPDLGSASRSRAWRTRPRTSAASRPATLTQAHITITFTFRTGGPGKFRWQCFVPCAATFIFGNGGPMQTPGWMDGYLEVV